MTDKTYKYFAFISYSHRDIKFALWLQRHLEQFSLPLSLCEKYPTVRRDVHPLFRDEENLNAGALDHNIETAITQSRYLIVICSEHSARPNEEGKRYINDEIYYFVSENPEDCQHRIIPIIYNNNGELSARECMPPLLRALNILGIDVARKGLRRALNDVVAALLGLDPAELWRERRGKAATGSLSIQRKDITETQREECRTLKALIRRAHREMFNFRGREGRVEYWQGTAWLLLWYSISIILLAATQVLLPLAMVLLIPLALAHAAMTCRRLHDVGMSGWLQLVHIALPGFSYLLIAPLCALKGTPGRNLHGLPPAPPEA